MKTQFITELFSKYRLLNNCKRKLFKSHMRCVPDVFHISKRPINSDMNIYFSNTQTHVICAKAFILN